MSIFFYISLFIIGTLFGSFGSVIIYRIKSNEPGILNGRSHCPKCNTMLGFLELIPIISYIINIGKCKFCKTKISSIYPILEITTGILFSLIGYFLIDINLILEFNGLELIKLLFWLSIGFITIIYSFYDILFLEIPEVVLALGIGLILIVLNIQTNFESIKIIENIPSYSNSGGFSALFFSLAIIGGLYTIMLKGLKEFYDIFIVTIIIGLLYFYQYFFNLELSNIAIFSGIIGALGIFLFFFLQILVSKGKWMGGGDLRIAILMGLILGIELSLYGVFISYLAGSIIGIGLILKNKIQNGIKTTFDTQVPFGPFLAIGFFITLFFSEEIINFMNGYLYI